MTDPRLPRPRRSRPLRGAVIVFVLAAVVTAPALLAAAAAMLDPVFGGATHAAPVPDDWPRWADWSALPVASPPPPRTVITGRHEGHRFELSSTHDASGIWVASRVSAGFPLAVLDERRFIESGPLLAGLTEWRASVVLWRPLVAQTSVAALLAASAAVLPGVLIRRRRSRRGLCPSWGYPRGSSDTCAECGSVHPVPTQGA